MKPMFWIGVFLVLWTNFGHMGGRRQTSRVRYYCPLFISAKQPKC